MFTELQAISDTNHSSLFIPKIEKYRHYRYRCRLVVLEFNKSYFDISLFGKYDLSCPPGIQKSVIKRQAEFLAGRYAAKVALNGKHGNSTIDIGLNRQPIWPDDVRGSISHSNDRALCLVTTGYPKALVGVDIEEIQTAAITGSIAKHVLSVEESRQLSSVGFTEQESFTLIFSAKESLFKALYPYVNIYFGFECVRLISIDTSKKTLLFRLVDYFSHKYNLPMAITVSFNWIGDSVITIALQPNCIFEQSNQGALGLTGGQATQQAK